MKVAASSSTAPDRFHFPSLPLIAPVCQAETLSFRGTLKGHVGWVTAIATGSGADSLNTVVSCSRDKSLIVWNLTRDGETYGVPHRRMNGYALMACSSRCIV